ncbi:MAG: hypothetical protein ABI585_02205 [Betaproteobacteria bacterium]
MTTPILVVATIASSIAPARFARALAQAGASVSLLVPSNAHARHTRHVARVGLVPPQAPATRWAEALFALMDAARPRAIAFSDARALELCAGLAFSPPPALRPKRASELAARLAASLGGVDRLASTLDPLRRAALLAEAGVRAPPAPSPSASDLGAERAPAGTEYTHHVAACEGRVLASATAEHLVVDRARGPTVLRFCAHAAIDALAERAIGAIGASGCCSLDVVVDAEGAAWLLGIDRHVGATMHVSQWLGVDLVAAWLASLDGRPYGGATSMAGQATRISVAFPQEWQRDRESRWLREHRVDVPWDDQNLLDAILQDEVAAAQRR